MEKQKYALYTGCTAKVSTPELLKSTLAVAKALDIEFEILEEASCCGASHLQDVDDFLSLVLNARNIVYAEQRGLDLVTICNTCQINLSMTKERLDSDPVLKQAINEKLAEVGLEYKGTSKITHLLYILKNEYGYENIKRLVKKPLKDFNIAPFYGCHNIRPTEIQKNSGVDESPYNPTSLDDLIRTLGGDSVQYKYKNSCCGFHVDLQSPKMAGELTGRALLDAKDSGADAVVTPCPLCHLNFDVKQHAAECTVSREINIPVFHLAQIVGLALGLAPKDLGLNHHIIKPEAFI